MNYDRILFFGSLIVMVIVTAPWLFEYMSAMDTSTWTFTGAEQIILILKAVPIVYLITGVAASAYYMVND